MIPYIIITISFFLDGILSNFLPYMEGDLSFFTPLITLVSIFLVEEFFDREDKKYYITAFVFGFLYDLFYTDLLFLNGFLFLFIAYVSKYIYKNERVDYVRICFYLIFIICLYELSVAGLIVIFNVVPMSIERIFYKISHSLLLNLIYGEIVFLIIRLLPNKYKRKRLN